MYCIVRVQCLDCLYCCLYCCMYVLYVLYCNLLSQPLWYASNRRSAHIISLPTVSNSRARENPQRLDGGSNALSGSITSSLGSLTAGWKWRQSNTGASQSNTDTKHGHLNRTGTLGPPHAMQLFESGADPH